MKTRHISITGRLLLAAVILSVIGTPRPAAAAARQTPPAAAIPSLPTINVSGTGEVTVMPDIARVTVGVFTNSKDSAQAANENARRTDAVLKAVKALGVAEKDIQTADYSVSPQLDYQKQPPVLLRYDVRNMVRITVRKRDDAGKILDAALKAGANVAEGITFDVSDPQKARDEALTKAVADATRKATLMWKAVPIDDEIRKLRPLRLMELTEASTGGFPPPIPMMRMSAADSTLANTPVQAGETKITATVTARFTYRDGY